MRKLQQGLEHRKHYIIIVPQWPYLIGQKRESNEGKSLEAILLPEDKGIGDKSSRNGQITLTVTVSHHIC